MAQYQHSVTAPPTREQQERMKEDAHFNLDTQHTLSEHHMSDGFVDKVTGGLTRMDHEPIGKLHRFGTGGAQLAGDDDFATLCA